MHIAALLFLASTACWSAPPTRESVLTLMEVIKAESMMDQAYSSVDQMFKQAMAQETAGRKLTEEQQRLVDAMPAKITALMREEMSWTKMEPIYVGIYQETFTQEEIDGLIGFYRSPVGQSFVAKMPVVMHRSMSIMQVQMQSLIPKLKQAMEELVREAKLPPRT
jgi:hypothetical protein